MQRDQIEEFILANTRLLRPPLVPEVALHLAEESMSIWHNTEEELGEMNVPPPYWAFAWAGGQALARYILDVPEAVRGKSVLDIGSGSGLVALSARLAGAKTALANDIDVFATVACAINAEANGLAIDISRKDLVGDDFGFDDEFLDEGLLPWPTGSDGSDENEITFPDDAFASASFDVANYDVVCLGDTFYEEALAIDAMSFAESARLAGARILIGDPSRSYFPRERFQKITEYEVPVTRELEDNEIKNSAVWEFHG